PAPMAWTAVAPAAHCLDAAYGFGHVAGRLGMTRALELAGAEGIGLVAVRRSLHYGAAGYYCALAADAGYLGFTCSNAFPKVAPFGGTRAVLGTNPLAFGCPTPWGAPLLVDLATSALAGSDVRTIHGADGRLPAGSAGSGRGPHPLPGGDPGGLCRNVRPRRHPMRRGDGAGHRRADGRVRRAAARLAVDSWLPVYRRPR